MMVIRKIMKITVVVIGDFLDDDDDGDDDDIYIMMECMSVCLSRFCLFCRPPAKLMIYI